MFSLKNDYKVGRIHDHMMMMILLMTTFSILSSIICFMFVQLLLLFSFAENSSLALLSRYQLKSLGSPLKIINYKQIKYCFCFHFVVTVAVLSAAKPNEFSLLFIIMIIIIAVTGDGCWPLYTIYNKQPKQKRSLF